VLQESIDGLVDDSIKRGVSLILEGVHVIPSQLIIKKWIDSGGIAAGCVLTITDPQAHKDVLSRRGELTTKGAEQQIKAFSRIRMIQDEMIRLAKLNNWLIIEQKLEIDPIDQISAALNPTQFR
jgi:2-phosphoglycerate kinase